MVEAHWCGHCDLAHWGLLPGGFTPHHMVLTMENPREVEKERQRQIKTTECVDQLSITITNTRDNAITKKIFTLIHNSEGFPLYN